MSFTEEQWEALCKLRLIHSPARQKTPSTQALRMVLVDGATKQEAAKANGVTRQAVSLTVCKTRECIELAKVLAGAPEV